MKKTIICYPRLKKLLDGNIVHTVLQLIISRYKSCNLPQKEILKCSDFDNEQESLSPYDIQCGTDPFNICYFVLFFCIYFFLFIYLFIFFFLGGAIFRIFPYLWKSYIPEIQVHFLC